MSQILLHHLGNPNSGLLTWSEIWCDVDNSKRFRSSCSRHVSQGHRLKGVAALHNFLASIFTAPGVTTWRDMSGNTRKNQVTRLVTLRHQSTMSGALGLAAMCGRRSRQWPPRPPHDWATRPDHVDNPVDAHNLLRNITPRIWRSLCENRYIMRHSCANGRVREPRLRHPHLLTTWTASTPSCSAAATASGSSPPTTTSPAKRRPHTSDQPAKHNCRRTAPQPLTGSARAIPGAGGQAHGVAPGS